MGLQNPSNRHGFFGTQMLQDAVATFGPSKEQAGREDTNNGRCE